MQEEQFTASSSNSPASDAVYWSGIITVSGTELDVVGNGPGLASKFLPSDEVHTGVKALEDPLASLPAPTWDPANYKTFNSSGSSTFNLQPGYYKDGISVSSGNPTLNLDPGIYILGGPGLSLSGNLINLTARGVMLYFTGSTSTLTLATNGQVIITPPDPALYSFPGVDTYAGVSIFQARDDYAPARITGCNNLNIQGTFYLPNADLALDGNVYSLGKQVIVDTLHVTGIPATTIYYDGRNAPPGQKS